MSEEMKKGLRDLVAHRAARNDALRDQRERAVANECRTPGASARLVEEARARLEALKSR